LSLSATSNKVQFDLSGGAVSSYPFAFKFWATSEVKAVLSTASGDITLAAGVDFNISSPGVGGTLTRLSTWPAAVRLTIYRELDLSQTTDLINGSTQNAEIYESMVDRAVAITQQIDEKTDRIVRFPITDPSASPDMPSAGDRKGQLLGFDNITGDPIPVAAAVGSTVVSPFAVTLLDDLSVLDAQKTLGLISSGAAVAIDSTVQTLLESAINANAQNMLESGDIAGMEADAEDVDYDGTTVNLNAATAQEAIEAVGGAMKSLITDAGLTYVSSDLATLFKRACRAFGQRVGAICEFDDKFAPDADNPYLCLDSDQDILAANWPQLVAYLRGVKVVAGGASSFAYTASGGVLTLSGTGVTSLLADLAEDIAVHGSYTSWLSVTIGGVEYPLTAVTPGSNQLTVGTSPPASGTLEVYARRVPNDATKARVFKDQGRATYSHDGSTYLSGLRRRDRGQGHRHNPLSPGIGYYGKGANGELAGGSASITSMTTTGDPTTDPTNGTPRTGPTTDAANSVKFRYYFGGIFLTS